LSIKKMLNGIRDLVNEFGGGKRYNLGFEADEGHRQGAFEWT